MRPPVAAKWETSVPDVRDGCFGVNVKPSGVLSVYTSTDSIYVSSSVDIRAHINLSEVC